MKSLNEFVNESLQDWSKVADVIGVDDWAKFIEETDATYVNPIIDYFVKKYNIKDDIKTIMDLSDHLGIQEYIDGTIEVVGKTVANKMYKNAIKKFNV